MSIRSRALTHTLTAAALALLLAPATAMAQRQTETVDRTLPFPSGGTLDLKNFSGSVRITAGSSRDFVMKAVRRGREDRLKEIRLSVETSGSRIIVEANDRDDADRRRDEDGTDNVIETDFEIQVPPEARVEVDAFSSDVIITGVRGAHRVKTFSGRIEVDATSQGANPELGLETFSGDMRLRVADGARGEVAFSTFSGDLDSALPLTLRSSSRRNMRAELPGGSGRTLNVKSFSGSLRLTR
jgi:DUF4097 and DUF4098 domain-containing protein YvlB